MVKLLDFKSPVISLFKSSKFESRAGFAKEANETEILQKN